MSDRRVPLRYYAALAVALAAVSSSAVLVKWADAGAVSLAFWRTLGGAIALSTAGAALGHSRPLRWPRRSQLPLVALSGLALAAHFATWLASLELTSVAASVTLVSTAPLLIAAYLATTGHTPQIRTWFAIAAAIVGTAIIAAGDLGAGGSGLRGDALALAGAAALACYLIVGDRLRTSLPTLTYAAAVYATAAIALAPLTFIIDGGLGGYSRTTWLAIGAMILGPQLIGHTLLNLLLRPLGSVTVSLSLLVESVGATIAVWLIFDEVPPAAALIGGPVVLGALAFHLLTAGRATG